MARTQADSADMTVDGDRVRARRERLGLDKSRLASEAQVSRETLAAIEGGQGFRHSSLSKIERVLDAYEAEAGIDVPPLLHPDRVPHIRVIQLENDRGKVVVEAEDMTPDEAYELAMRLLTNLPRLEE